jgi:hypothetical protein
MSALRQVSAQTVIILGFAISAAASVISYFETVTTQGYGFTSLRETVLPLLNPLMMIATLFAWWWLSRVGPGDEGQRVNLLRAYIAFALQYLITTALVLFLITPFRSLGNTWMTSALWLQLIGAFVSALGLFLVSRILSQVRFDAPDMDSALAS